MNLKRSLGITFIFLSIIISVLNINLTGAVIGSSISNYFSLIAIVFFIGGIGLLMDRESKKTEGDLEKVVRFEDYKKFLTTSQFEQSPTDYKKDYREDRNGYFKRSHNISEANKYLQGRLQEINQNQEKVTDIRVILGIEKRMIEYDKTRAKATRDTSLDRYIKNDIDENEFASELNKYMELTGGVYKPGITLSVKFGPESHALQIDGQQDNSKLARAIYAQVLENSPGYQHNCEFHFSKQESTKHHKKGLIKPKKSK